MSELRLLGIRGVPEVTAGADLAGLLLAGLASTGDALRDGDLLVVASKVVAKAEGRRLRAADRDDAVAGQTVRVVAERRTPRGLTRIVESRSGPVLAAAGVDASNVDAGMVLLLPADPDASARALRARLAALTGRRLGVVVTDTLGRPWRDGQTDVAIGAAGVAVTDDLRGARDAHGNPLEVTVRALADEIAAAADLVKGKLEGVPVAVVRGLAHLVTDDDGPGAASLLRAASGDWFRFGHVEAVRTALGAPPGTVDPPSVTPEPVATRARRALAVAMSTRAVLPGTLVTATVMDVGSAVAVQLMGDDPRAVAAVAERLAVAAWGEELDGSVDDPPGHAAEHGGSLTVRLHDRCTAGDLPESSG